MKVLRNFIWNFFKRTLILPDGRKVSCNIGNGLSDEQRLNRAMKPEEIVGKIIEVAYFSLSQNCNTNGTKTYSLRFPRLKSIRKDKVDTSAY